MSAEASRRWRKTHPEAVKEQKRRAYARATPEQRAAFAARNTLASRSLRLRVLMMFGKKCNRCGFSDVRALQIDHKNGGGTVERKTLKNVSAQYKKVLAEPSGYQLLCANCNWIKRDEDQEYRYKSESKSAMKIATSTITED